MGEIQAIANFVSKKISKVRWRPTSKYVVQKPSMFASGSWDDNVRILERQMVKCRPAPAGIRACSLGLVRLATSQLVTAYNRVTS